MSLLLMGCGGNGASGPVLWNPGNEPTLVSWFDMSNPASYNLTTWTKRFGTGPNATKSLNGPTKSTTAFGGSEDALVFNGNTNVELIMSNPNIQETVFVYVLKFTTLGNTFPRLWTRGTLGIGVAGAQALEIAGIRSRYLQALGDADDYDSDTTTSGGIFVGRAAKASRVVRWNGTETAVQNTLVTGSEPALNEDFKFFPWDGFVVNHVCEVAVIGIFRNTSWSNLLAQKIEGYIAHQGLGGMSTAVLPIGHPYKTTAPNV